jgi:hypothetical protein
MESIPTLSMMPGGAEILVILFILGTPFLMMVLALVDILRSDFEQSSNKLVWTIVVILLPFIGSLIYFLIGRNQKVSY